MPLKIPEAMELEHEELHEALRKATRIRGKVGEAAKQVARVLHPHFVRENELALPVIGIAKELAEEKNFHYSVINDSLEKAFSVLASILVAETHRMNEEQYGEKI